MSYVTIPLSSVISIIWVVLNQKLTKVPHIEFGDLALIKTSLRYLEPIYLVSNIRKQINNIGY